MVFILQLLYIKTVDVVIIIALASTVMCCAHHLLITVKMMILIIIKVLSKLYMNDDIDVEFI